MNIILSHTTLYRVRFTLIKAHAQISAVNKSFAAAAAATTDQI